MHTALPAFPCFARIFILLFSVLLVSCGGGGGGSGDTTCLQCKTVFVTDAIVRGNFGLGSAIGGVAEADAICQGEANSAGLSGTYFAWISDDVSGPTITPVTRFTQSTDPYVLPTGAVVADDWADLTDGTLQSAINLNASGGIPGGNCGAFSSVVFTGTTASGTSTLNNCSGWTGIGVTVTIGRINRSDSLWSDNGRAKCGFTSVCGAGSDVGGRLYCFEQ